MADDTLPPELQPDTIPIDQLEAIAADIVERIFGQVPPPDRFTLLGVVVCLIMSEWQGRSVHRWLDCVHNALHPHRDGLTEAQQDLINLGLMPAAETKH